MMVQCFFETLDVINLEKYQWRQDRGRLSSTKTISFYASEDAQRICSTPSKPSPKEE